MDSYRVVLLALFVSVLGGCAAHGAALDLEGRAVDPLASPGPATVLLFVMSDCPIANRFAPEFNSLHERYGKRGVAFWLVYTDPATTPDMVRTHMGEYDYSCSALRDPDHVLVTRAGATISPEAAVYTSDGRLVYRGRINDRFVAWNRTRLAATQHDLADAIDRVLDGTTGELVTTEAVGCYLGDLR